MDSWAKLDIYRLFKLSITGKINKNKPCLLRCSTKTKNKNFNLIKTGLTYALIGQSLTDKATLKFFVSGGLKPDKPRGV